MSNFWIFEYFLLAVIAIWALSLVNYRTFGFRKEPTGAWVWLILATAAIAWVVRGSAILPVVFIRDTVAPMVVANPLIVVGGFFAYMLVGALVAYMRWRDALTTCAEELEDHLEANPKESADKREAAFRGIAFQHFGSFAYPPLIRNSKGRFSSWIVFWPYVCCWLVLHNPIRRACRAIYNVLGTHLQSVSDQKFAKFRFDEVTEAAE